SGISSRYRSSVQIPGVQTYSIPHIDKQSLITEYSSFSHYLCSSLETTRSDVRQHANNLAHQLNRHTAQPNQVRKPSTDSCYGSESDGSPQSTHTETEIASELQSRYAQLLRDTQLWK